MDQRTARKLLGLRPDESPTKVLAGAEQQVRRRQAFIDNAPSPETKSRLQNELAEYQHAVATLTDLENKPSHPRRLRSPVVMILVLSGCLVLSIGLARVYLSRQMEARLAQQQQDEAREVAQQLRASVQSKLNEGHAALEQRQWNSARHAFEDALRLKPDSEEALSGLSLIQQGRLEELNQKLFYLLGDSQLALEAGKWSEAEELANKALLLSPKHPEALAKLKTIDTRRQTEDFTRRSEQIDRLLDEGDLMAARVAFDELKKRNAGHPGVELLDSRLQQLEGLKQTQASQAVRLLGKAKQLDNGEYSEQAVAWMEEALRLAPKHAAILEHYQKISAYTRSIGVPGDAATISLALEIARANDRIVLAPGIYREAVVIHKPISLEGDPRGGVWIKLPAGEAPPITVLPTSSGTRLTRLNIEHEGFDHDQDRASLVVVKGAEVTILSCTIQKAAGHGLAVIDGARVKMTNSSVRDCGWDGVSVYGRNAEGVGSRVRLDSTLCENNLQHGLGLWNGGSGEVVDSRMLGNGLCGIVIMSAGTSTLVKTTLAARNRGAGILVSDGAHAELLANRCDKNLLSGLVVRGEGGRVNMNHCVAEGNGEVGIVIYQDVQMQSFKQNKAKGNKSRQIWTDAKQR